MTYKVVQHTEVPDYLCHFAGWLEKSKAPHMRHATLIEIELGFRHAVQEERVIRVGDYIAVFNIHRPWWSAKPMLCEELVMRVGPPTPDGVLLVVTALEDIARAHNCAGVFLGDEQGNGAGQAYAQLGYRWLGSSFYSEVPWVS